MLFLRLDSCEQSFQITYDCFYLSKKIVHMGFLSIFYVAALGVILYVFWRNKAMKKRQDQLVAGLKGQRYWRINMAREPFFKRWLRLMPCEAKGVLVDEGGLLRLRGFWLKGNKAFNVEVPKGQCTVQWLGNSSLRAGNMYWAKLTTARWTLMFSADTGMYALPSREALADIFRSVFPGIELDPSTAKDFALEKNPRSLLAAILFIGLMLFALVDTFVFSHYQLTDAQLAQMLSGITMVAAAIVVLLIGIAIYVFLTRGKVPARESLVLSMMLSMGLLGAALPIGKRVDQMLAAQPTQMYAYRMTKLGYFDPVDASVGLPKLKFTGMLEYWQQFPADSAHQMPFLRGPLGLWQLDHQIFDPPIMAFYKKQ